MKLCSPHLHYLSSHPLRLLVLPADPGEDSRPLVHLGQCLNPDDTESSLQLCKPVATHGREHFTPPGRVRTGLPETRQAVRLLPVVFSVHAGEALQAPVAGVEGRLEIFVDHHLLRSGVQHAEEPGRGGSQRGAAGRSAAASSSHAAGTAAHQSPPQKQTS